MKLFLIGPLIIVFSLLLTACGQEQFATTPQKKLSQPNAVVAFQQVSCSNHTLVKPEVDILYIVDNSSSNGWVSSDVKNAIQNTINSISLEFDYRVIGTPLLETATGNEDYQVLSKSSNALPSSIPSTKIINSSGEFSFFSRAPQEGTVESGLRRVIEFMTAHQSDGLFRQNAYLFIVLVSNGRDTEVESLQNTQTVQNTATFNSRKTTLINLKRYLNSQQFRLFSMTANTRCKSGYWPSPLSYAAMSQALYNSHIELSAKSNADHYDICSNVSSVFNDINSTIKQIILPHTYKYWPITFTETATGINTAEIRVFKSSPSSAPTLLDNSSWTYISNPNSTTYNTRMSPSLGEPTTAKHLIEFTPGNEITYPSCVQITSTSNTEYFGFVVLPKAPKLESVVLKINGRPIPQSSSNGWSYVGEQTRNIKVNNDGFSDKPEVIRSGHFLQLNNKNNYYKSGENVELYYVPATKS